MAPICCVDRMAVLYTERVFIAVNSHQYLWVEQREPIWSIFQDWPGLVPLAMYPRVLFATQLHS